MKHAKSKANLIQLAGGQVVRDLNKNGKLDIYEDPRRPVDERVEDLLGQMTLSGQFWRE